LTNSEACIRSTRVSLGKSFSANVALRNGQQLKRDGLYAWARHPSSTGLWLIFLAYGLHSGDGLSVAIAIVPTTIVLIYRIRVEEAVLRSAFGKAYDDYARSTRRLIPFVYGRAPNHRG
jgi:protein-S-isoprenylcysteine O-methyltransferase Ste14